MNTPPVLTLTSTAALQYSTRSLYRDNNLASQVHAVHVHACALKRHYSVHVHNVLLITRFLLFPALGGNSYKHIWQRLPAHKHTLYTSTAHHTHTRARARFTLTIIYTERKY